MVILFSPPPVMRKRRAAVRAAGDPGRQGRIRCAPREPHLCFFGPLAVVRDGLLTLEDKPLAVVLGAAGSTIVVSYVLAASAGWAHVHRIVYAPHSWAWLGACLIGETVAYAGYVLTIRDVARVDRGPEMDLAVSAKTVVAGFGVFAATRASGGFAVDYWALRREGAGRRDAVGRVLALGFLEYATLSIVALVASFALYARLDGHAGDSATLPALLVIPAFAVALWATSRKRSARLSRPQPKGSWLRRTFADSVAGARKARTLLRARVSTGSVCSG